MRDRLEGLARVAEVRVQSERIALARIVAYASELRREAARLGLALAVADAGGSRPGADLVNELAFTDRVVSERTVIESRVDALSQAAQDQAATYVGERRRRELLMKRVMERKRKVQMAREELRRDEAVQAAVVRKEKADDR